MDNFTLKEVSFSNLTQDCFGILGEKTMQSKPFIHLKTTNTVQSSFFSQEIEAVAIKGAFLSPPPTLVKNKKADRRFCAERESWFWEITFRNGTKRKSLSFRSRHILAAHAGGSLNPTWEIDLLCFVKASSIAKGTTERKDSPKCL